MESISCLRMPYDYKSIFLFFPNILITFVFGSVMQLNLFVYYVS